MESHCRGVVCSVGVLRQGDDAAARFLHWVNTVDVPSALVFGCHRWRKWLIWVDSF